MKAVTMENEMIHKKPRAIKPMKERKIPKAVRRSGVLTTTTKLEQKKIRRKTHQPKTPVDQRPSIISEEYIVVIEQADGLDSEDGDTEQTSLLEQGKSQETPKTSQKRPQEEPKEEVVKEKNRKDTDQPQNKKA